MKKLILLFVLAIALAACEKDDFCVERVTPQLIIRFYDATNTTQTKAVDNLFVWPDGRDSIFSDVSLDSIFVPLDVNSGQTIYNLSRGTTQDQLTITYEVEEVFVSRSCGFKAIFNNVTVSSSNAWLQSLAPLTITTINNESAAHVQIFH